MRKIAITQRLVKNQSYHEIRECLDINFSKLLSDCGFIPIILPYEVDFQNYFSMLQIDGVVLTGGNDLEVCNSNELSFKRDNYEKNVLKFCIKNEIPVFGICRGMQVIADYFNSSFKAINNQVNVRHSLIINTNSRFKKDLQKISEVNSYHDFTIDQLSNELIISATNETEVVKAIEHKTKSIFGQMWHPERESPFSKSQINLIQEFFNENINKVIEISKLASESIMKIYNKNNFKVNYKIDKSPLTDADVTSNKIIIDELEKISKDPLVSEESHIEYKIRKNFKKFWLIDPLDGTKDFISKNGEFTVNIALIYNNQPILGVVCVPKTGDVYYAIKNGGAYKNGVQIFNNSKREDLIGADSRFHSSEQTKAFFKKYNIKKIQKYGSSIKLCKLAEGIIDVYPRLNGTKEWDTAASHIIVQEAGCKIIDIDSKKELLYNKKSIKNNYFIACRNNLSFEL